MLVFNYFTLYEIAQKQVRPTKNVPVRLVLRKTVVALTTRRGDPQSVLPRYQRIGTRQRHLGCLGPCWLRSMRSKYRCQA
jgi:hypothetical protein